MRPVAAGGPCSGQIVDTAEEPFDLGAHRTDTASRALQISACPILARGPGLADETRAGRNAKRSSRIPLAVSQCDGLTDKAGPGRDLRVASLLRCRADH